MVEFERSFDREKQIFPLHCGSTAAVCVRVRRKRVLDLHRRSGFGTDRFRLKIIVDDFCVLFEFGLFPFIVQPFLHGERNKGILVGEKGNFKCTLGAVRKFWQKQEDDGCGEQRKQHVNYIENPGALQPLLRRFDGGVTGKRDGASRIEEHQDADCCSGEESEEEHARQQRPVEQEKCADDEEKRAVAGASSHEESESGDSDKFQTDLIRKFSGPEAVIRPKQCAADENKLKYETFVH